MSQRSPHSFDQLALTRGSGVRPPSSRAGTHVPVSSRSNISNIISTSSQAPRRHNATAQPAVPPEIPSHTVSPSLLVDDNPRSDADGITVDPPGNNVTTDNLDTLSASQLRQLLRAERESTRNLTAKLLSVQSLYEQLVSEAPLERPRSEDFRRVMLLKAQNMQLERQVRVLKEAQESSQGGLHEATQTLRDLLRAAMSLKEALREDSRAAAMVAACAELHRAVSHAYTRVKQVPLPSLQLGWEYARDRDRLHMSDLYAPAAEPADPTAAADQHPVVSHRRHLNLHKVHELESVCHQLRCSLLAIQPVLALETAVASFSVKAQPVSTMLAQLTDQVRVAAHELSSLSVLLPPSSILPPLWASGVGAAVRSLNREASGVPLCLPEPVAGSRPASPSRPAWVGVLDSKLDSESAGSGGALTDAVPEWALSETLTQFETAIRDKRLGSSAVAKRLLAKLLRDEVSWRVQTALLESELAFLRQHHTSMTASVTELMAHVDALLSRFDTRTADVFQRLLEAVTQCLNDWSRNPQQVSVQRLLAVLNEFLPSLQPFLDPHNSQGSEGPMPSRVAPMVRELQAQLAELMAGYQRRIRQLQHELPDRDPSQPAAA